MELGDYLPPALIDQESNVVVLKKRLHEFVGHLMTVLPRDVLCLALLHHLHHHYDVPKPMTLAKCYHLSLLSSS